MGASLKVAWNAGELSPLLDGRTDLAKYQHGCSVLLNEIPTAHGPVYRRPGTRFVADCGAAAPVLVPFVFNRTQSYVLAIGNAAGIAVYADRGRVLDGDGDQYWFGTSTWMAPPRRADGTSRLSYTQSGDTLFVCDADGGLPLMAIVRHDNNDWSIAPYEMTMPPVAEWKKGTCLIYKQLYIGASPLPDGEYYLAVGLAESKFSIAAAGGGSFLFTTTDSIEIGDENQSTNPFVGNNIRGKVIVDLSAAVSSDATTSVVYGGPTYTWAQSASLVSNWIKDSFCPEGAIVRHLGRFYYTRNGFQTTTEPLHEGPTSRDATDFAYIGNGTICFEIIESGITDTFKCTNGTLVPFVCARVKLADAPENQDRMGGSLFEKGLAYPRIDVNAGFLYKADVGYKCMRWSFAAIRDDLESDDVGVITNIGSLPDNVSIFRERLVLSVNRELHISTAGDFPNFSAYDGSGQVVADCALDLDLLSGDLSSVSWMAPSQNLVLGSFGGERSIGEQNISNAFGPTNVKVDFSTSNGSRDVPPAIVGSDVLYIDRSGRRVRRSGLALDPQDAADLSVLSEHIGASSPFIDSAWQQSPSSVMWLVQADGNLCGLTYDRAQDVVAWHRHDIGGDVLSICSIPSPDGTRDDLWLVVRRVLGASTKIYLEVMPDDFALGRPVADQCFLDCSLTYEGAPSNHIYGLSHFPAQTVIQGLADGYTIPSMVVSPGGSVELPFAASKIHLGLHHPSRIRTMRLEKSPDGVSQGKIGRIHRVVLRLMDSVGVKLGPSFVKMDLMEFRVATMAMDDAVPVQTLDLACNFPGDYEDANYVCIEQGQPLPLTILSAAIEFELQT